MGVGKSLLKVTFPNESCGDFGVYVTSADRKKEKYVECSPNGNYSCKLVPQAFLTSDGGSAVIRLPYAVGKENINITCEPLDSNIANDIECACNISDLIKYNETTDYFGQKCLKQAADNMNLVWAILFGIVFAILVIVVTVLILCIKCNFCTPIRNWILTLCPCLGGVGQGGAANGGGQAEVIPLEVAKEQKQ